MCLCVCVCVCTCAGVWQDTSHPSPLIRALAVRTMGCIRVDRITEYLCDPLKRALADEVRALCCHVPACMGVGSKALCVW